MFNQTERRCTELIFSLCFCYSTYTGPWNKFNFDLSATKNWIGIGRCSAIPYYSKYETMYFLKLVYSRPLFRYFVYSIQLKIHLILNKICPWLDLNRGSLVSKATELPTEPLPLAHEFMYFVKYCLGETKTEHENIFCTQCEATYVRSQCV